MQAGADVIPVFAFGQSQTYKWLRPGPPFVSDAFVKALSRRIGGRRHAWHHCFPALALPIVPCWFPSFLGF
jgi:hypothetical protein